MRDHEQQPDKTPGSQGERGPRRDEEPHVATRIAQAGGALDPAMILALQRSVGNAAVVRLLEQQRHPHSASCGHPDRQGDLVSTSATVQRSSVHEVLRSPGRPMAEALRTEMEARLGADFGDVRLHDGAAAARSAAQVGAHAYTSGSHIVVGDGGADRHTLAHELTHVIQQRSGPVTGTDTGDGLRVSDPADRFEREAEANARRVMSRAGVVRSEGRRTGAVAATKDTIQRFTIDAATGCRISQTGRFAVDPTTNTLWVGPGAADISNSIQPSAPPVTRILNGVSYTQYHLVRQIAGDCLHAAEEIINNRAGELMLGGGYYSTINVRHGSGTRRERFGSSSDDTNRGRANRYAAVRPHNEQASPGIDEAFLMVIMNPGTYTLSQFHAAAVVAEDGNDRATIETFAGNPVGNGSAEIYTVGDAQDSFHAHWRDSYYQAHFPGCNPLTVVLRPAAHHTDLVPAGVPNAAIP